MGIGKRYQRKMSVDSILLKNKNLNIKEIKFKIMQAIILAAGMGRRLSLIHI